MTKPPLTDDDPMPCGAHQGTKMKAVPAPYLDWLIGQPWLRNTTQGDWARVRQYILANLTAIQAEIEDD